MAMTETNDVPAVLCLGEAMVAFAPASGNPGAAAGGIAAHPVAESLAVCDQLQMFVAGAEANVAIGLADAGQRVEWFGRVGDDPFGARIRAHLGGRGVAVGAVIRDPDRPTGLYFKDRDGVRSTMYYYRRGSAASAMGPVDLDVLRLADRRLVHVSGITPALSPDCDALVAGLLEASGKGGPAVSFDVNYRAKLWPVDVAGPRLLTLARAATIVLVGRDEAETLWGAATPEQIRALLPEVPTLVVKDAHIGATEFSGATGVFVPTPPVEVVEPIGAGDAFAAGYLAAWLDGEGGPEARLLRGHASAARVLGQVGDS